MAKASEEGSRVEPIVVTGLGIGTCLGWGLEATWKGLRGGASGLGPITRFALGDYPVRTGGEAPPAPEESSLAGGPEELQQLAAACLEACRGAGYENGVFPDPHRSALVIGSSLAGSSSGEAFLETYASLGPRGADYGRLEGYYIEGHLDLLARRFGILGPSLLVSNACAAGASSIAKGASLLRAGRADRVLCAGYDPLSIFTFSGFGSLQALSVTHMKPFSTGRDGMLLGDGYAALVLERLPDARERGARLRGVLRGHGESADSHHLTHPHPEGSGAALAMRRALAMARLAPADIDYVNCHGTATKPNDASEAAALRAVFGERLASLPISSSKPFFGHTLGGAGTVEAVVTLLSLQNGYLPPTPGLDEVDPSMGPLDLVPVGREARIRRAMSNSFGFGGSNASLIFAGAEEEDPT